MAHRDFARVGDSGVHNVEGNVAGRRAAGLTKAREQDQAKYAAAKAKIQSDHARGVGKIDEKFDRQELNEDSAFQQKTVGLVTASAFREFKLNEKSGLAADEINAAAAEARAANEAAVAKRKAAAEKAAQTKLKLKRKCALSFAVEGDEEEDEELPESARPRFGLAQAASALLSKGLKCPHVETSFLPDRDRESRVAEERDRLKLEWEGLQETVKQEPLEVTYSYFDGAGHRRSIIVKKGQTIGKFVQEVQRALAAEFPDLRGCSSDNLLYVKEDLFIPHHYTFYDLIVTKARGKSGPLFNFDVHDDVRMRGDARVEKDESHPGKIVQRAYYERNKHIFPASRWEVFDPYVQRDRYTIKDTGDAQM